MLNATLRVFISAAALASAACAAGPPSRGSLGVYAARPSPPAQRLAGCAGGSDSLPPWSWLNPEQLRPDTGLQREEELLGWLIAGDSAQRAEAQVRLLSLGESLLPTLETLATRHRDEEARAGLLEFLRVLTARRVHPDRLGRYPELSALAAESVARGQGLVTSWETQHAPQGLVEEFPVGMCGAGPQPESKLLIEGLELQGLRDRLGALGGLALPGLERLLASPTAAFRLQAIALVATLKLHPTPEVLERLRQDTREVELDGRYAETLFNPGARLRLYRSKVSLADRASRLARGLVATWREIREDEAAALRIEDGVIEWFGAVRRPAMDDTMYPYDLEAADLGRGLLGSGGRGATDAQQFWNNVRPFWRLWWKTVGPRPDHYNRGEWFSLPSSATGLQSCSEQLSDEKTILRIAGVPGVEAELLSFARGAAQPVVVQRGVLPLTLSVDEGFLPSTGIRLRSGGEWVDSGPFFHLARGNQTTVWLQPELFRRHLEERRREE